VIQIDILPTALAAAQIEIPPDSKVDGVNLLPYLTGENNEPPHVALYWRFGRQMAIRKGDWKLVRYDSRVDGMRGGATEPKLYNLAQDLGETKDLMAAESERAAALQADWDEWNKSNVPPLWRDGRAQRRNAGRQQQPVGN
jgi:arylsulfatase A-like enzyme